MAAVFYYDCPDYINQEPEYDLHDYDANGHWCWLSLEEKTEWYSKCGNNIITSYAKSMKVSGQCCADDLESVGLEGFVLAVNSFDPRMGVGFPTYCSRVVRNKMMDWIRHEVTRINSTISWNTPVSSDEDSPSILDKYIASSDNVPVDSETAHVLRCTLECISLLKEPRREVLCRSIACLNPNHKRETQKEIAQSMGVSQALISKTLERARQDLRVLLWSTYRIEYDEGDVFDEKKNQAEGH